MKTVAAQAVVRAGEISDPARWKTMHQDVINHCVPRWSREGRGILQFYYRVVKKSERETLDVMLPTHPICFFTSASDVL